MIVGHVIARVIRGLAIGMVRRWFTTLIALVLIGGGGLALASRGSMPGVPPIQAPWDVAAGGASATSDTREMVVEKVEPLPNRQRIDLYLKEKNGNRRLVMAVGQGEALAILADQNPSLARANQIEAPPTYDLMRTLVRELGGSVDRVVVNSVTSTEFQAKVVMSAATGTVEVDSRPSDAIVLALRSKAPIYAEASVLDKAGVAGTPTR